jgi:hypothetical protein
MSVCDRVVYSATPQMIDDRFYGRIGYEKKKVINSSAESREKRNQGQSDFLRQKIW